MKGSALALSLLPIYCLVVAAGLGVWRYRAAVRFVDKRFAYFSVSHHIISGLVAPVALVADWTALSWAAHRWISAESSMAATEIGSALLLEGVALLFLLFGYALARASVRRVHLYSPWLDKLIASRNSTSLGALE